MKTRKNSIALILALCLFLTGTGAHGFRASEVLVGIGETEIRTEDPNTPNEAASSKDDSIGEESEDLSSGEEKAGEGSANVSPQGAASREDDSWMLLLVNRDHPIPDDYVIPELTELARGHAIDSRAYPSLQKMFDDARAVGLYPYITSSYRTAEKQQQLMDDKIEEYKLSGYSQEDAVAAAESWVAVPGTSEHQLGLSVDISSDPDSGMDPGTVWYWLEEHCWEYGFIRRYPEDKTDITGIINEPWHFRYVGTKAAREIHESGQCLEEYLGITQ